MPILPWYIWAGLAALGALLLGAKGDGTSTMALPSPAPGPPGAPELPAGAVPVLRLGSSGGHVAYLRSRLGLSPSDQFDAETDAAVRAFQQEKGLEADGVVGKNTWGALGVSMTGPSKPAAAKPAAPGTTQWTTGGPKQVDPGSAPVPSGPSAATTSFGINPGGGGLSDDIGQREAQILAAVQRGAVVVEWVPLLSEADGRACTIFVMRRALRITDPEDVIVNVSFETAQKICDALDGYMLTSRVADLCWRKAQVRIKPPPAKNWQGPGTDNTGSKTFRMRDQSAHLDALVGAATGLVSNEGKDWVVTARNFPPPQGTGVNKAHGLLGSMHNGANFGFYGAGTSKSPGGETLIQSIGLAHDRNHTDYSQLFRCMQKFVLVDGEGKVDARTLVRDPRFAKLLSDEGPLPELRHPDV